MVPTDPRGNSRHEGTNVPNATEERDNGGASRFPKILLQFIPGTQSFRRVASSNIFKKSEHSHFGTSFSYVHCKLSSGYRQKRRLHVQNRSAGWVLSCTNTPFNSKYLRFAFENKVFQLRVLPFSLNAAPQVFTHLGHAMTGYPHRLLISVIPFLNDWLVHHPDRQVLLCHQSQLLNTLELVDFVLNKKKSELDIVQDIQFLDVQLLLDLGRAFLPESKAREIIARACELSSQQVLSYQRVAQFMGSLNWASGLIPVGRLHLRPLQCNFHSLGLKNRFTPQHRSDQPALANLLQQWKDLSFLISGMSIRPFQVDFTIFTDASTQGWGAHMGDSQISGTWTRWDRHINFLELKAVFAALCHWGSVLWGHQVLISTDNTTVVSYLKKQGGTHSLTLLHLVVDLFMWLQAQDIARYIPGCLNVIAGAYSDQISQYRQSLNSEIVNRIFQVWGTPMIDMFATIHNTCLLQFMSPIP